MMSKSQEEREREREREREKEVQRKVEVQLNKLIVLAEERSKTIESGNENFDLFPVS